MFGKKKEKDEEIAINSVEQSVKNEVTIHFTPSQNYLYKGYIERDFEGTMVSPTTTVYFRDKNNKLHYINGSYVILPAESYEDIEAIIEDYQLNNEDSVKLTVIDLG